MSTDTALIEKREEVKRRLAAGEYKTLVDVVLEGTDRLIRKIIRRSAPLPIWLITALLSIVITFIGFVLIYVAGDLSNIYNVIEHLELSNGLGIIIILILPNLISITTLILISQRIGRILVLLHDELLDATDTLESIDGFEDWLKQVSNWRLHFLVAIFCGLLNGLYAAAITNNQLGKFVGYGYTFSAIISNTFAFGFFYLVFMILLLSVKLRLCDLKLYSSDPSSSELIYRLSEELDFFVYFVAIYAVIVTLASASLGIFQAVGIVMVLILWLPIIAMFILNQTSLSSIIRRAKWRTLNEIQVQVEKHKASKNFGNQQTIDAINRLMDYHDRVKATRNSAIDSNTVLNFINSLLLPLIAFILGNLDKVLLLFSKKT